MYKTIFVGDIFVYHENTLAPTWTSYDGEDPTFGDPMFQRKLLAIPSYARVRVLSLEPSNGNINIFIEQVNKTVKTNMDAFRRAFRFPVNYNVIWNKINENLCA